MYKLTKKEIGKRLTAFGLVLALGVPLVGCAEKVECEIPEAHIHKYVGELSNGIRIQTYHLGEYASWNGYQRQDEYIKITKDDERAYDRLNGRFVGVDNWDYLYFQMAHHHDYLMFYWYREEKETKIIENEDGSTETTEVIEEYDGWTDNPYHPDNTGDVKLYHHMYYGYKLVYKDGKYKLEESPLVNDIREIIFEYPYFSEDCVTTVYKEFRFNEYILGSLSPDDDFNPYRQPDLSNKELYPTNGRGK